MTVDDLRQLFPAWRVWTSDAGRWYATWPHDISDAAAREGLARTVEAHAPDQIVEQLTAQERLRRQLAH